MKKWWVSFVALAVCCAAVLGSFGGDRHANAAGSTALFRAVDTMKESRDQENPDGITAAQKAQTTALIASINTTHITVDTQYDYPTVMKSWIDAVRAAGKMVWYRPNWNHWEGTNGAAGDMTPTQYIDSTVTFIKSHPTYFKPGDIFDACPEPEQGRYWYTTYGNTWTDGAPNAATDDYNQFFVNLSTASANAFASIGVSGVITNIRSTNGWFAFTPAALYPSTVQAMGYVTTDSYPGQDVNISASDALVAFKNEINLIHTTRNVPVVLGEFGWTTWGTTTEAKQLDILQPWFNWLQTLPWVAGINYWVGPGYATTGSGNDGTTDKIFKGTTGNWTLNASGAALQTMFGDIANNSGMHVLYDFENSLQGWQGRNLSNGPYSSQDWYYHGAYTLRGDGALTNNGWFDLYQYPTGANYSGFGTLTAHVRRATMGTYGSNGLSAYLYIKTGSGWTQYGSPTITVNSSGDTVLTMSLSGVPNLNDIKEIGVHYSLGASGNSGTGKFYVDYINLQ